MNKESVALVRIPEGYVIAKLEVVGMITEEVFANAPAAVEWLGANTEFALYRRLGNLRPVRENDMPLAPPLSGE